jgi:hypothetical protein
MDITGLKELATNRDTYRFFEIEFSIGSDSLHMLNIFRNIFGRFKTQGNGTGLSYYILNKGSPSGLPALIADDRIFTVDQSRDLAGYAYLKIVNSVLTKIKTHYLLHAASLSFHDRGLILPAASGSGKTTLVLELLKRGFHFLSDDISAVSKSDFILHPFPKSLGILSQTLDLCPEADTDSLKSLPMIGGGEKKLLDIENLSPGKLGTPCKLQYLVLLGKGRADEQGAGGDHCIYIVVNNAPGGLMNDFKEIDGVNNVSIVSNNNYPFLKLTLRGKDLIYPHIENICYRHKVLIFDVSYGRDTEPDFNAAPRLEKIPGSVASLELLQRLKGIDHKTLLESTYKGSVSTILLGLSRILQGVACYRLSPGRLRESADFICSLLKNR